MKALIEYDGTRYLGWQVQPGGPTVQAELEAALYALTGRKTRVAGSGRTDAGVHALGQVASFRAATTLPAARLPSALNAHLPRDISVRAVEDAPAGFHARFDARAKHYRYAILNRRPRPALDRRTVYHLAAPLDVEAMQAAAAGLVGRHDFRSFATTDPRRAGRSTERELLEVTVRRKDDRVTMDFVAGGFLYNMARCLAGTLVYVGLGRWTTDDVKGILAAKDRRRAGPNLPARGLTLVGVYYREFGQRESEPVEKNR